jgi:hypothetical protein
VKRGAGGVVSEGSRAHRACGSTKVEYGAYRPAGWMTVAADVPPRTFSPMSGASASRASTGSMPPAWAKIGSESWERIPTSGSRAERTSPTRAGAWHWKTATRRVMAPSIGSSKTMSAWLSPSEGRSPG